MCSAGMGTDIPSKASPVADSIVKLFSTSCETSFLGWDAPLLPAAAATLRQRFTNGHHLDLSEFILVLPTAHSASQMNERLRAAAQSDQLHDQPPKIITVGQLAELRLTVAEVREFDEEVPAGDVIGYEPSPGAFVAVGTEVVIYVSDGPAPRLVPAVIGLAVDEATNILEGEGFVVVGVQGSPTLPVLATDPPAGEIHARGTEIVIATSLTAD